MNDEQAVRKIIESYYDPKGLDYSIGRINMGGCDFSVRKYTYRSFQLYIAHFVFVF